MTQNSEPVINIAKVRHDTKQKWLKEQRGKINFLERVENSVPFWLIVIAGALWALSAPHTAAVFDHITPGWGWVAPAMVEFGLMYTAFSRRKNRQNSQVVGDHLIDGKEGKKKADGRAATTLEVLLFITAVIVNGAGAFAAVSQSTNLTDKSIGAIWSEYATLPAFTQVALLLVPVIAFIIPIGTLTAGDGLAVLVIARRSITDTLEDTWQIVGPKILFTAFHDALIQAGVKAGAARQLAASYVGTKSELSEKSEIGGGKTDNSGLPRGEARKRLDNLYADDPGVIRLPAQVLMERTGAGKSAVYDWLAEKRNHGSNGHAVPASVDHQSNSE